MPSLGLEKYKGVRSNSRSRFDQMVNYSNYWEDVREYYYPFESGLKAGTAEVYEHEIPGGQYSNLRPEAIALGLEQHFETIKKNYAVVNRMFGDIVKVTPSSKVVGDMALFMTANGLTEEDVMAEGDTLVLDYVVRATDNHGASDDQVVRVEITGSNSRPDARVSFEIGNEDDGVITGDLKGKTNSPDTEQIVDMWGFLDAVESRL